jgi:virginiamycin A acetyltransferase
LKRFFKRLADTVCFLMVTPVYCIYKLLALAGGRDGVFWSFSQMFSLLPGKTGSYLRKNFYRLAMASCHPDCAILFGTLFSQADTEIGKGVYIGPNCNIGKCRIEDHCTIGSNVHIMSGKRQHRFDDPDIPVQCQGGIFEKVTIGEDTWIGNCALIMANIGKKCIVGAGSVVIRDVPDFSIVVGNPARVIDHRPGSN